MIEYHRGMSPRPSYPTDLSDREWNLIKHLVPEAKSGGRPEAYPKREILNGVFYLLRSGCSWRMLPHDLPPWRIVYHYFRQWRQDGTWHLMHDLLRSDVRAATGTDAWAARLTTRCGLCVAKTCSMAALSARSARTWV